jgi:hypothetical protein
MHPAFKIALTVLVVLIVYDWLIKPTAVKYLPAVSL